MHINDIITAFLKKRNTIFIYITHDPNDMQKFDHIIYLGDEYEKSL